MKLVSLSIENQYRSLKQFSKRFLSDFPPASKTAFDVATVQQTSLPLADSSEGNYPQSYDNPFEPKQLEAQCLVGINGSGKSQLLELLADIFSRLEHPITDTERRNSVSYLPAQWAIEYILHRHGDLAHIRIEKTSKALSCVRLTQNGEEAVVLADVLPDHVIGYTSGENETLSYYFRRIEEQYARRVRDRARDEKKEPNPIPFPRLLFLDYDANAAVVLANYLFQPRELLDVFQKELRLIDLRSFQIIIRFDKKDPRPLVMRSKEINATVEKLRRCAVFRRTLKVGEAWEFDFLVNDATRQAFQSEFGSARELFLELHQLRQLNALCIPDKERQRYSQLRRQKRQFEAPTVAPDDRVFRVEGMDWYVEGIREEVSYSGMSDGEHQFLLITGMLMLMDEDNSLFLLDEPETHFNPLWRARFFKTLNSLKINTRPQILLTTHSPFVVSDCRKENVYHFQREEVGERLVVFDPSPVQTYGSSFQFILRELYNMKELIAENAYADFIRQVADASKREDLERLNFEFGESFEKHILYEKIADLDDEIASQGA